MHDIGELRYLVLTDRAVPYLLARVRWPDVAQAMSAATPDWLDDPGLFDLPYNPSALTLSFPQAASVAAGWGRRLHAEPAENVPSYIRRMPANWSDLSPSERRTWGLELVGARRTPPRRSRRLGPFSAKIPDSSAAAEASRQIGAHERQGGEPTAGAAEPLANGRGQLADVTSDLGRVATERRCQVRVRLNGRAHIRHGHTTVSAGLVDLGDRGVCCVLPEVSPLVASGVTLRGPFLLEAEVDASRVCLDVAGQVSWHRSSEAGTHFGVAFGELVSDETEGVRRILAAATRKRSHR